MKQMLLIIILVSTFGCFQSDKITNSKPKLVVGIVVDQMRYDYIPRFWSHYSDGGFKRLIKQGFNFKNAQFNYIPTFTAPGHASVFTGTTPSVHGIIGNNFFDRKSKEMVYCVGNSRYKTIGSNSKEGQMSPQRLKTTTLADQNRLATQFRGKTIGIAIKDRGAILPAGHTANAAYWFEGGKSGDWISSSFYMDELPSWVKKFNESEVAVKYLKTWDTYKKISSYTQSGPDNNPFEGIFKGKEEPVFPYHLKKLADNNDFFDIISNSAYGNSLTTDFALAAIKGEGLGKDSNTDVLTLSYSSTDYVGHRFGVNSKEIQDTYIRLDRDIERLLNFLDQQVGKGNYTLFLTADHAAVQVPSYLQSVKIPAGYIDRGDFNNRMKRFMQKTFGRTDLVENFSNFQIFLNKETIAQLKNDTYQEVVDAFAKWAMTLPKIENVFTAKQLHENAYTSGIGWLLKNGYNQKRSGDIMLVPDLATISYSKTGSTHGSGNTYDTHVPLIFFGNGINKGSASKKVYTIDASPTLSVLLGNAFPNGTTGDVLTEVID